MVDGHDVYHAASSIPKWRVLSSHLHFCRPYCSQGDEDVGACPVAVVQVVLGKVGGRADVASSHRWPGVEADTPLHDVLVARSVFPSDRDGYGLDAWVVSKKTISPSM